MSEPSSPSLSRHSNSPRFLFRTVGLGLFVFLSFLTSVAVASLLLANLRHGNASQKQARRQVRNPTYVAPDTRNSEVPITAPTRLLSTTGTAVLELEADRLELRITFRAEDLQARTAMENSRKSQHEFLRALKAKKFKGLETRVTGMSLYPTYRTGHPAQANNAVTVALRNFSQAGEVIDLAVKHGADYIYTRYHNSEMPMHKSKVRADAVQAARKKAEELAEHSDVALGVVVKIREQDGYGGLGTWGGGTVANVVTSMGSGQNSEGHTQNLKIVVHVDFEIVDPL